LREAEEATIHLPKPITPQELYTFLYVITGENIPHTPVCKDHQTPWDFCVEAFFNKSPSILAIGNRGGGKTRTVAKLITAELRFIDGVEIASVGAIETQAAKCFRYVSSFLDNACPSMVEKAIRKETILSNGSTFQELVGTVSGTNSPHPAKLRADEVELMKPEVLDELLLIPSTNSVLSIPSNIILTSTRKYTYGLVQSLIDNKDSDFKIFIWCYKEVAENCPASRRGASQKKYVIRDHLSVDENGKKPEIEVTAWSNCGSCPLLPSCRGDLAYAQGFMTINDLISAFKRTNIEVWVQQMECRRVSSAGKVYPQFDEATHAQVFDYDPNWGVDISIDFGFQNPCCVGFWQENEETGMLSCFDEIYESGLTSDRLARRIKDKLGEYKLRVDDLRYSIGDPAQIQQIHEMNDSHGFNIEPINKGAIAPGLDLVRVYLISLEYGPRLRFNRKKCPHTIKEMKDYHNKRVSSLGIVSEEPVKKGDHGPDQTRYYVKFINDMRPPEIRILGA
jgi:hypothetical protein